MPDCDDINELLQVTLPHNFEITIFEHSNSNFNTSPEFSFQRIDTSMRSNTKKNAILNSTRTQKRNRPSQNAPVLQTESTQLDESINIASMDLTSDSSALNTAYDSAQMSTNPLYPQEPPEHVIERVGKIQIKCQPRSRFRPRTENESKTAAHYLRCEVTSELEYPAIYVPQAWACDSDTNLIEVTLVDIKRQPHPYTIDNKTRLASLEQPLIFQPNETNQLYFRLTNDDFLQGFKPFMIEFIKSKQNNVITKELIRTRKLDHSMLRFVRIYRDGFGKYHRDIASEEYSSVMIENYGDVAVEQLGPRYGSMTGQELVFVVCKGRIMKDELSVIISEHTTGWSHKVEQLVLSGNVFYFAMPIFPYPHTNQVSADVHISCKDQTLYQSKYIYMNILDQVAYVTRSNSTSDIRATMIQNNLNDVPLAFANASKNKSKKRLNQKTKGA